MSRRRRRGAEAGSEPVRMTHRRCLRCDRAFASWGAANRLCARCRQALATAETPAEVYHLERPQGR